MLIATVLLQSLAVQHQQVADPHDIPPCSCFLPILELVGACVRVQAYKAYKLGGKVSELLYSPALYGIDLSAQNMPKPRARSSPMMAVVGNTLWLFGGTVEVHCSSILPCKCCKPFDPRSVHGYWAIFCLLVLWAAGVLRCPTQQHC